MHTISGTMNTQDERKAVAAIPMPVPVPDNSAPDWSDDIARSRWSAWRVTVGEKLMWLQAELDVRDAPPPPGVREAMDTAHLSTKARTNLPNWYSGAHIERAWRSVHFAESRVLASSPDLAGRLP